MAKISVLLVFIYNKTIMLTIWRIYSQVNGNVGNTLVTTSNTVSFSFNFSTDFIKIHKLLSLAVQEFPTF